MAKPRRRPTAVTTGMRKLLWPQLALALRHDVQRYLDIDFRCRCTDTKCVPTALMCVLGSRTIRLSRFGPPAFLMAATTSAAVTEPNNFPESAEVFTGSAIGPSASIAALISLACSRSRTLLVSRARRISSACFWLRARRRSPGRAGAESYGHTRP